MGLFLFGMGSSKMQSSSSRWCSKGFPNCHQKYSSWAKSITLASMRIPVLLIWARICKIIGIMGLNIWYLLLSSISDYFFWMSGSMRIQNRIIRLRGNSLSIRLISFSLGWGNVWKIRKISCLKIIKILALRYRPCIYIVYAFYSEALENKRQS